MIHSESVRTRFEAKVDPEGPVHPVHGRCHVWTAGANALGYGTFRVDKTRTALAHRVAWELRHGAIPAGFEVCHRCDNPACQRDDHLFLGTHADNMHDMFAKGRRANTARGDRSGSRLHPERRRRGERHHWTKLTDAAIAEILALHAGAGITNAAIARRFGVSDVRISQIVRKGAR